MSYSKFFITSIIIVLACLSGKAKTDSLTLQLKEVEITDKQPQLSLTNKDGGIISLNMDLLQRLPQILGNANILHYSQLLPGIQTCSEYDAGIHIEGCDNAHNLLSIDNVEIYNASHLMGIFSTFNSSHFKSAEIGKCASNASCSNRLGGFIDMSLNDKIEKKPHLQLSIGPMSTQGTIKLPIGSKLMITTSVRAAYLNFLYSPWLKMDDDSFKYSFFDYNTTLLYHPNESDKFSLNFYCGNDNFKYLSGGYQNDSRLKWGNLLGSIKWTHVKNSFLMNHIIYSTNYHNNFFMDASDFKLGLPSRIHDIGYKGDFSKGCLNGGAEIICHQILPQAPSLTGNISLAGETERYHQSIESSIYTNYKWHLNSSLSFLIGIRGSYYNQSGWTSWGIDPIIYIDYVNNNLGHFSFTVSQKHQYTLQAGFSSVGLPNEFWFPADSTNHPQRSINFSFKWEKNLSNNKFFLSAEVYYKRLFNQIEYAGNILDLLYVDNNLRNQLIKGDGYNYGISLMLEKRKGRFTGWIAYTFGRALRRFPNTQYKGTYPANHERPHEFNGMFTFSASSKLNFGITAVIASGTPYTATKYLYILNENIMSDFGEHNAKRVPFYKRFDFSMNYYFKRSASKEMGINFSIYNILWNKNDLYYRLKTQKNDTLYGYAPFRLFSFPLPSISFFLKF